jgi:hypothetical protein
VKEDQCSNDDVLAELECENSAYFLVRLNRDCTFSVNSKLGPPVTKYAVAAKLRATLLAMEQELALDL